MFSDDTWTFINLAKQGYKVFFMPLSDLHVDDLIQALWNINMCILEERVECR